MAKKFALIGKVVFPDECVKENFLIGSDGDTVLCSAPADSDEAKAYLSGLAEEDIRIIPEDTLIAPAFIDIHCHGGLTYPSYEEPEKLRAYHRENGTGSQLLTFYRNVPYDVVLRAAETIKELQKSDRGLLGIHMEGPYLNPRYGASFDGKENRPNAEEDQKIIDTGLVKQWTFAPEVEGTDAFCRQIAAAGIVPAMGHSAADYPTVSRAVKNGARLVTHIFDATGLTDGELTFGGTKNLDFNDACMLQDDLYYEVINDRRGVHVRKEMIRLLEKTVGKERIIGITDCETGKNDEIQDVNFVMAEYEGKMREEICGSWLTMREVAKNFFDMGYSHADVFGFTSLHAAKLLGLCDKIGSLHVGKQADILLIKEDYTSLTYA